MRSDLLVPGDILLFDGRGLIPTVIRVRTWEDVCHAELFLGAQPVIVKDQVVTILASAAARGPQDTGGGGVGTYPLRLDGLRYVMRPQVPFDLARMIAFHNLCIGQRYDTWGLVRVFALQKSGLQDRAFCSEHVARVCRKENGGPGLFNERYDCDRVSPGMLKCPPVCRMLTVPELEAAA